MDFESILVKADGPIGRLTLNRPERLNALGPAILRELTRAAHWFDELPDVRVVIVGGAGRAFSAGADLKGDGTLPADTWHERREAGQVGLRMTEAIAGMRAVTIARVQGYAVGGGLVLVAACDLRVAAEDAVFFIPEVDLGLPLAWGAIPRLVSEIGPALAKELVMTCRRFSPAEAKAAGFLNRVVPESQLDAEVEALAREIAAKPSVPVTITKEHVNAVARHLRGPSAFGDGEALLAAQSDPDSREAARTYRARTVDRAK